MRNETCMGIPKLSLEDMTFGVELEFCGLKNKEVTQEFETSMIKLVGKDRYKKGSNGSATEWVMGWDRSIHCPNNRYFGYELRSPALHHTDHDYEELKNVLFLIKTILKGTVDNSCGTHIHIGNFYPHTCDDNILNDEESHEGKVFHEQLKGLSMCYGRLEENIFDKMVIGNRRRSYNENCSSCLKWDEYERAVKFNLQCFGQNHTIENRHHHGTLDVDDIWSWMEINGRFILTFLKDNLVFEKISDLKAFMEAIHAHPETKQFYRQMIRNIQNDERQRIEKEMSHVDYRSERDKDEDNITEPPALIEIKVLSLSHRRKCA